VNLQLARQLAETDPPALVSLLDEIARDVHNALESARELAHRIYPALLLDRGLSEAIGAAAAAIAARVEPASLGRYAEDLEATVYFCCIDALHDAAGRTSGAATVRLWQDGATLNFEVESPGPQEVSPGPQLDSAHDRIGALGGRLSVVSTPEGGTRVSGMIPLGP
jgi:signal transduction histidine kinase